MMCHRGQVQGVTGPDQIYLVITSRGLPQRAPVWPQLGYDGSLWGPRRISNVAQCGRLLQLDS